MNVSEILFHYEHALYSMISLTVNGDDGRNGLRIWGDSNRKRASRIILVYLQLRCRRFQQNRPLKIPRFFYEILIWGNDPGAIYNIFHSFPFNISSNSQRIKIKLNCSHLRSTHPVVLLSINI